MIAYQPYITQNIFGKTSIQKNTFKFPLISTTLSYALRKLPIPESIMATIIK